MKAQAPAVFDFDQPPSHFFRKLVLAAPASFFPFLSTAWDSQLSFMHFFTELVLAAPESGLPSLLMAFASHADIDCADAGAVIGPSAKAETTAARMIDFITPPPKAGKRIITVMRRLAIALVLVSLTPARAMAWGSEGHRIVAEIAEQHLEPGTARQVRELLAIENNTTLADVANWADQIRRQRPETASWHFVDIPISAASYDAARDCPAGNCVVVRIEQLEHTLRDTSASSQTRLEALKFLVHFAGDLHQPLHASDNNDRGGNEVRVIFEGRRTNLHAVWDTGILAPAVNGDERAYALRLGKEIQLQQAARWSKGSPEQWANESHAIAVSVIYGKLRHAGTLPPDYASEALPIVDEQLERAGVRLAAILNRAFRP